MFANKLNIVFIASTRGPRMNIPAVGLEALFRYTFGIVLNNDYV